MEHVHCTTIIREPWNKGRLVGQKAPFKLKEIWAIRVRLQLANRRAGGTGLLCGVVVDAEGTRAATALLAVREEGRGGDTVTP
jgi:hypothetical protein